MGKHQRNEWGYKVYTLNDRVGEIRTAIKKNMYQSALALALTIPDICGKFSFPEANVGTRYSNWFDEYITPSYMPKVTAHGIDSATRIFNGYLCYMLRCAYLHSGDDNISNTIKGYEDSEYKVKCNFELTLDWEDISCLTDLNDMSREYTIRIDAIKLCNNLCNAAVHFANGYPDMMQFEDYSVSIYSSEQWKKDRKKFNEDIAQQKNTT